MVLCPPFRLQQDVDQGRIRISVKFMPSEALEKGEQEATENVIEVKEASLLVDEEGTVVRMCLS